MNLDQRRETPSHTAQKQESLLSYGASFASLGMGIFW